jgi:hypothetical protein
MQDYPHFHKNRTNLLLHIVVVPLFVLGVVYALTSAVQGRWLASSVSRLLPLVALSRSARSRDARTSVGEANAGHVGKANVLIGLVVTTAYRAIGVGAHGWPLGAHAEPALAQPCCAELRGGTVVVRLARRIDAARVSTTLQQGYDEDRGERQQTEEDEDTRQHEIRR